MAGRNPIETVNQLVRAINNGDLAAALALYEPDGALVAQPGTVAKGSAALRAALAGFIALRPTLSSEREEVIEVDGVALYCARWRLRGTDPGGHAVQMSGRSSDVLRRQPDGDWLIAVDNPWGSDILG